MFAKADCSKHRISFATDLVANFGCNQFRIKPDIVSKSGSMFSSSKPVAARSDSATAADSETPCVCGNFVLARPTRASRV